MSFSLLSPALAFFLCAAITALAIHVFVQFDTRWYHRVFPFVVVGAFILAAVVHVVIGKITQAADELPSELWLMVMPFTASVSLLIGVVISQLRRLPMKPGRKKRKQKKSAASAWPVKLLRLYVPSAGLVVGSFVFSFVLVNDYYQYYPSVSSLFSGGQAIAAGGNPVDLQYAGAGSKARSDSIEASLTDTASPAHGKVTAITIPATASHFAARQAYVYEPPVALARSYVQLPVLVLMAGLPGSPQDWLNGGNLQTTLDDFAKQHDGITPLVFMVDELGNRSTDTECVDSARGNVETYLTVDVPNYIKNNYAVSRDPVHWSIGGLSLGGTCGVMLTLRHPDIYRYFLDLSGDIDVTLGTKAGTITKLFNGSQAEWAAHQPSLLLSAAGAKTKYKDVGGYFAVGRGDSLSVNVAARQLYLASRKDNLDVAYEVVSGQHTFAVWRQTFADALPWLSNRLGATVCSGGCSN